MTRKWNDLTENEQWLVAKECSGVERKFSFLKEQALEDAEDGCGELLYRVNTQIKGEKNVIRRKHGLESL